MLNNGLPSWLGFSLHYCFDEEKEQNLHPNELFTLADRDRRQDYKCTISCGSSPLDQKLKQCLRCNSTYLFLLSKHSLVRLLPLPSHTPMQTPARVCPGNQMFMQVFAGCSTSPWNYNQHAQNQLNYKAFSKRPQALPGQLHAASPWMSCTFFLHCHTRLIKSSGPHIWAAGLSGYLFVSKRERDICKAAAGHEQTLRVSQGETWLPLILCSSPSMQDRDVNDPSCSEARSEI